MPGVHRTYWQAVGGYRIALARRIEEIIDESIM
jgi:hypothetical protein